VADDKFEEEEAKSRAGVEQPEGCREHRLVEAADPADDRVGSEEGEVVEADDGGVDRFGRDLGEEGKADRQEKT
jgi:hypothetical protein